MKRRDAGFTLIELVVVVAILALLAAAAMPAVAALDAGERYALAQNELAAFEASARAFARDTASVPATITPLVAHDGTTAGWLGPYLTTRTGGEPVDPWGANYTLTSAGGSVVRLRSPGSDGVAETDDDVVRDVDLTFDLRTRTTMIVETVNRALALYNGQPEASWTPLPADIDGVVKTLQSSGYLNSTLDWSTDGFGAKLSTSAAPVTFVAAGSAGSAGSAGTTAAPSVGASSGGGDGGASTPVKKKKKKKKKKVGSGTSGSG